jgi:hypothetical protein
MPDRPERTAGPACVFQMAYEKYNQLGGWLRYVGHRAAGHKKIKKLKNGTTPPGRWL